MRCSSTGSTFSHLPRTAVMKRAKRTIRAATILAPTSRCLRHVIAVIPLRPATVEVKKSVEGRFARAHPSKSNNVFCITAKTLQAAVRQRGEPYFDLSCVLGAVDVSVIPRTQGHWAQSCWAPVTRHAAGGSMVTRRVLAAWQRQPYRPQSTITEEMRSFHPRPTKGTLPAQVWRRPAKFTCSKVVISHPGAQASEEIRSFQKPLRYSMLLLARIGS